MKRPAEEPLQLVAERPLPGPPAGNPFAGISLTASGSGSAAGLFTAATELAKPSDTFSASASSASFPSSSPSKNPFMGLSLYSSAGSSGGLFTSAAGLLPKVSSTHGFAANSQGEGSRKSTSEARISEEDAKAEDTAVAVTTAEAGKAEARGADESTHPPASSGAAGAAGGSEATGEEGEEVLFRAECKLWKLVKQRASEDCATSSAAPASAAAAPVGGVETAAGGPPAEVPVLAESQDAETSEKESATASDSGSAWRWQEKGVGVVRVNRSSLGKGGARLVMRMRGVHKVLLNTPIWPTAKYDKVGQKSVQFVGVDEERSSSTDACLCAYRLNLHSTDQQGKCLLAIMKVANDTSAVGQR